MKHLLTIDELINHMKNKGIQFEIVNESDARVFLSQNNYYMKLASYRTNYSKCVGGSREGQYQNLDFAYLKELSTLDMHLRYVVLQMCLDIEHCIKVSLIDLLANTDCDDGYSFLRRYYSSEDPELNMLKRVKAKKSGEYCKSLIEKYYPYIPIYAMIELISFGDLMHLCSYYQKETGRAIVPNNKFMNTVRDFRNASAHSNCLINHLTDKIDPKNQPDVEISTFVLSMSNIGKAMRTNQLRHRFSYNFITLLYVYDKLATDNQKHHRYAEIKEMFENRFERNKEYFISNTQLCGVYRFIKNVVDNLYDNSRIVP